MKTFLCFLLTAALAFGASPEEIRRGKDPRQAINVLRVASAVVDGETVTVGTVVFEADTTLVSGITAGNIRVDVHGGSTAAAVGTLTSDNTNVTAADTVTIGAVTYTFRASVTTTANEVKIGTDADATLLNLIRAINHTGTPGTDYGSASVIHPTVSAAASVTSHAFAVTALIPGAGGNAIASTEASTHLSWGGSTLASGVSPTAAEFTTALDAAINASNVVATPVRSVRVSANEILITVRGQLNTACTETLAGSNNAWANATLYGGTGTPLNVLANATTARVVNATEAALQTCHFYFSFNPSAATVQLRDTSGVLKAFDGAIVITGNRVDVNASGSTDPASTDILTITASE